MDLASMPWHHRKMARRWIVYVLAVLTALEVGSVILIPMLGENGTLDTNPLLQALVVPFMETWPFGPPFLLMLLFGFLGHSRRVAKVAARAAAGLLLYVPLALIMMGYAFSGRFVLGATDVEVCAVALILGALLAWFGFKSHAAGAAAATEGAA
jgi:hypothetical protein